MTRNGRRPNRGATLACLVVAVVLGTALTAAAQPTPAPQSGSTDPQPRMGGQHPMAKGAPMAPGMGPGMGCCAMMGRAGHLQGFRRGGAGMPNFVQHLLAAADKIGLSDAQKNQLQEIRHRVPATLMPKRQAVMEARMDFQDLMAKKDAATADLRKAHDKLQKAQDDLRSATFDLHMQARDVLTPEQRDKLHEQMGPMKHAGGPGPMGMVLPDEEQGDELGAEF